MVKSLWSHQQAAVSAARAILSRWSGALLAHHMGAGKTATALTLAQDASRILVVCPKSVIPVWRKEAERMGLDLEVHERGTGTIAAETEALSRSLESPRALLVCLNYQAFWREPLFSLLYKQPWDWVIADEAHLVKSPSSKQSRSLARLAERSHHARRLGLSGTPLPQGPLDAYGVCRFLDPRIFGSSYAAFRSQYTRTAFWSDYDTVYSGPGGLPQPYKYRNLPQFEARLGLITHRIGPEALADLPPVVHVNRYCELEPHARRVYRELQKELIAEVHSGVVTAANAAVKCLRLSQVTGGTVHLEDGEWERVSAAKSALLTEVLDDLSPDEPLVLFARFHADLDACRQALSGRMISELSGRMNQLAQWQAHGGALVVQPQAGGLGIDLTQAHTAIWYSLSYSLSEYEQALARLHRPGQTRPVTYVHLLAQGTIDEVVEDALRRKADLASTILASLRRNLTNP